MGIWKEDISIETPNLNLSRERNRRDELRVNERIRIPEIRVIGPDGSQWGVFVTRDALNRARDLGLDLVEISPTARPPVCKIMDYGKYKYEQSKKKHEQKKKQTVIQVKELKLGPRTDEHDFQTKLNHLKRFLEHGDKIKITIKFRGREMAHTDIGMEKMQRIAEEIKDLCVVEQPAKMEGRALTMIVMSNRKAPKPKKPDVQKNKTQEDEKNA